MSGPPPGTSNGSDAPPDPGVPGKKPFPRLSSFKMPRDLTLGASSAGPAKTNKKVFMPNLNVVRNKNKTDAPNQRENNKKDSDEHRRNKRNNKNRHNGPAVLKSSGVFSEGLGATERASSRSSHGHDSDHTPLTRPVLRNRALHKVDKELEEQKIKKVLGSSQFVASDDDDDDLSFANVRDGPVRLPISAGGTLYSSKEKKKLAAKVAGVVIKKEPLDADLMDRDPSVVEENKFVPETMASAFDSTDIVRLLNSDKQKIMLIEVVMTTLYTRQLPDNLPGRGVEEDTPQHKNKAAQSTDPQETKTVENRCMLPDLEEGLIGKIQIHKSGKVKLCIGDTKFDLSIGTQPCFRQDAVSVATDPESRTGTIINLGGIEKKLNVIPDWEALFKDVEI